MIGAKANKLGWDNTPTNYTGLNMNTNNHEFLICNKAERGENLFHCHGDGDSSHTAGGTDAQS